VGVAPPAAAVYVQNAKPKIQKISLPKLEKSQLFCFKVERARHYCVFFN